LQAARTEHLKQGAEADLDILTLAVKQLKNMWATANVFEQGFERLRGTIRAPTTTEHSFDFNRSNGDPLNQMPSQVGEEGIYNGVDWIDYFPFVTTQTSMVADKILAQQSTDLFAFNDFADASGLHLQDLFEGLDSWTDPKLFL
jgi:hypothetical protein